MFVVQYRKIWFILSAILIALSAYAVFAYGFDLSIDFKGGTITEVRYDGERPDKELLEIDLKTLGIGGFSLRPSESDRYIIRTKELSEDERQGLQTLLSRNQSTFTIERQNTIGPTAGAELKSKAIKAIAVVVVMIVLFITFAFRRVSKPVSSWKYGLATIVALAHDVIIPTGVFVLLGHFMGVEIDLLFITGLLAILGYSVHDTIVVFDRVRENLRVNAEQNLSEDFEIIVGKSVAQTFGRSINTSLTIFITLLALYLVGSPATKDFAFLLIIGIIIGTYSSIFVASPLLVTFYKLQRNRGS
ncbi:MAG: Protein translocase subunit SecF [Candidatus Azambacteria bacterium GW2011_GWF2_42_22]|nr:MAG: Protein translocase subunit SecF [Candidatus Azambacteria bacterium GW2011_GWF2_42_22]KKT12676.1 MAG: Protein translocase subunit SecF [Parcubacteria group bacterium GW2011_GWC1_43_30]KKT84978.1 MAG: Protein translocase subunit SecF [Parcubacteria group bacterium GW2011_GWD1_44_9]